MTTIPADVLAIAAVVTGGRRIHLLGDARRDAVSAMHALGYSRTHIAWVLKTQPAIVAEVAHDLGVLLHHHDQRPDPIALSIVAEGHSMRLTGADRDAALRLLAPRRKAAEIARLIGVSPQVVSKAAQRLGVHTNAGRASRRQAA